MFYDIKELKGVWVVFFIASILILGTFSLTQDVFAPPPQKPEKIKIDSVSWDNESQEFVLDMSLHCGIAEAGQHADFAIEAELTIKQNSQTKEVLPVGSKVKDVVRSDSCNQGDDKFGKIKVKFPWDRSDETVEGIVDVLVDAKILNPAGNPVGNGQASDDFQVEVLPLSTCGDGLVQGDEACDDANDSSDDGCFDCLIEDGWICNSSEPSVCASLFCPMCGEGTILDVDRCVPVCSSDLECFCVEHPDHPECITPDACADSDSFECFCAQHPDSAECFCTTNPDSAECTPPDACVDDPSSFACFCAEHPEQPECVEPPCSEFNETTCNEFSDACVWIGGEEVCVDREPEPTCDGACGELAQGCCEEREECAWYNGDAGFCASADEPPCGELNEAWCNEFADACVWIGGEEVCVPRDSTCVGSETLCGETCVDTSSSVDNCVACGVVCGAGESCNAGQCTCGSTGSGVGAGPACTLGQVCDGEVCTGDSLEELRAHLAAKLAECQGLQDRITEKRVEQESFQDQLLESQQQFNDLSCSEVTSDSDLFEQCNGLESLIAALSLQIESIQEDVSILNSQLTQCNAEAAAIQQQIDDILNPPPTAECVIDAQCPIDQSFCNEFGLCSGCLEDSDCDRGELCLSGGVFPPRYFCGTPGPLPPP